MMAILVISVCFQICLTGWLSKQYFIAQVRMKAKRGGLWRVAEWCMFGLILPIIPFCMFFPIWLEDVLLGASTKDGRMFLAAVGCFGLVVSTTYGWRRGAATYQS
jgi:hypothetical protein